MASWHRICSTDPWPHIIFISISARIAQSSQSPSIQIQEWQKASWRTDTLGVTPAGLSLGC